MTKKRHATQAATRPAAAPVDGSRKGGSHMGTSGRAELEGGTGLAQATVANSLEQVREILFGPQHRELARRLARMDAHLTAHGEELRSEARRRLEALEHHVNKECEALSAALESQRAAQVEAQSSAAREARDAVAQLEQRVKRLEEIHVRSQREFRQQLLDQAKSFIDEVQRLRDELGTALEREILLAHGTPELPAGEPSEGGQREPWQSPSEAA
jgi:phosphoglycerate-specific signal transduction histidine kinase